MSVQRTPGRTLLTVMASLALALAGCSAKGGKAGADVARVDTPPMTVAFITHAAPGDNFWDIVRKGAEVAAAKDNIQLRYASDADGGGQATLVQNAIDSKVDAIAVTLAKPDALGEVVRKAEAAGIPVVVFNAGIDKYQQYGALMFFGSDESLAGQSAGQRLAQESPGGKALCVVHEQGNVSLETRCAGVKQGLANTENLQVNGQDLPSASRPSRPSWPRTRRSPTS